MDRFPQIEQDLRAAPRRFLVTGAAGFIGSHLVERLLALGQEVRALDNFSTGKRSNLEEVLAASPGRARFELVEADVADSAACAGACEGVAVVLHQAALGSVPRSIENPLATHRSNVDGTVNLFWAARQAGVLRVVYASSSSVYGDHPDLPKVEERTGHPLSPYALTKKIAEEYAEVFARCHGLESIGLRYFNVFGRRQDPDGPYAAVIPRWVDALLSGQRCVLHGDGETSRDFCHVENVVRANLLSALAPPASPAVNRAYNVAVGERTTLLQLFSLLRGLLARHRPEIAAATPEHRPFRAGDVRHSLADVGAARRLLGYAPALRIDEGLQEALSWYVTRAGGVRIQ
jgi:UDP-N-acetylglucosamine 4-epimerase